VNKVKRNVVTQYALMSFFNYSITELREQQRKATISLTEGKKAVKHRTQKKCVWETL